MSVVTLGPHCRQLYEELPAVWKICVVCGPLREPTVSRIETRLPDERACMADAKRLPSAKKCSRLAADGYGGPDFSYCMSSLLGKPT